jgi:hypothetical protein
LAEGALAAGVVGASLIALLRAFFALHELLRGLFLAAGKRGEEQDKKESGVRHGKASFHADNG